MARCSQLALDEVDLLTHDDILSRSIFLDSAPLGYLGVTGNITPSAKRSDSASGGVSLRLAAVQDRYYEVGGTEDRQPSTADEGGEGKEGTWDGGSERQRIQSQYTGLLWQGYCISTMAEVTRHRNPSQRQRLGSETCG